MTFSAQSSASIFTQKYLRKCEDTFFILQNKYLRINEDSFGAKILEDDCVHTLFVKYFFELGIEYNNLVLINPKAAIASQFFFSYRQLSMY